MAITFDADTQQRIRQASMIPGADPQDIIAQATTYQQQKDAASASQQPQESGSWLGNNLKSQNSLLGLNNVGGAGGALAGAALGTAILPGIGTVIGGLLGGFAGGAAGEAGREKISGEQLNAGDIAKQGAWGSANELGGDLIGAAGKYVAGRAGDALLEKGVQKATQAIGATKNQQFNFAQKFGETIPDVLQRNGAVGMTADQIGDKVIAPIQSQFDQVAKQSGIKVPLSDIRSQFLQTVQPLLSSTNNDDVRTAQNLLEKYDHFEENLPVSKDGTVDIGDLTKARQSFDAGANYKNSAVDPYNYNANKLSADAVRRSIQGAADQAGATIQIGKNQVSLKDAGLELSKLRQIQDIAGPNQYAAKAPLSLTAKVLGGVGSTAGAVIGGLPGALVGGAGGLLSDHISTNPRVISAISRLETAAGSRIAGGETAADGLRNAGQLSAGNLLSKDVSQTVGNAIENPQQPNTGGQEQESAGPSMASPSSATGVPQLQGSQPNLTRSQYQDLVAKDLATTGGRFIPQINAAYQAGNPEVSQEVQTGLVNMKTASSQVDELEQALQQAGGGAGPVAGGVESALGSTGYAKQNVKAYNDFAGSLGADLASKIYGASATNDQVKAVSAAIPKLTDSAVVADGKIAKLRALISARQQALQGAPINLGDVATAVGQ